MYLIPDYVRPFLSKFQVGDYVGVYKVIRDIETDNLLGEHLIGVCVLVEKYEGYIPKFNPRGSRGKPPVFIIKDILTNETRNIFTNEYLSINDRYRTDYSYLRHGYGSLNGVFYRLPIDFEYRKIDKVDVVEFLNDYYTKREKEAEEAKRRELEEKKQQLEKERLEHERKQLNDSITDQDIQKLIDRAKS